MKIRTRKSWGARTPKARSRQTRTNVRKLYLHWPAASGSLSNLNTDSEQESWLRGIQAFHMDTRGWSDIGYNFAVFQDGTIYRLRGLGIVPAAQLNDNTNTVAVLCVVGPSDRVNPVMLKALGRLKDHLDKWTHKDLPVLGHGQGPGQSTECPGPHVRAIISNLNRK